MLIFFIVCKKRCFKQGPMLCVKVILCYFVGVLLEKRYHAAHSSHFLRKGTMQLIWATSWEKVPCGSFEPLLEKRYHAAHLSHFLRKGTMQLIRATSWEKVLCSLFISFFHRKRKKASVSIQRLSVFLVTVCFNLFNVIISEIIYFFRGLYCIMKECACIEFSLCT